MGQHARQGRWWAAAIAALAVLAVGGWLLASNVQSSDQAASQAQPPEASWITARVERRLLARTVISRGDVRPEVTVAVTAPSSIEGEAVVTAIDASIGDQPAEGTRVIEVSGRPVFVLQGAVPVYRSLKPGMSGADVSQLQTALGRLGCDASADGAVYAAATKACVASFYAAAGYEAVRSSDTEATDLTTAAEALADSESGIVAAQLALANAKKGATASQLLAAELGVAAAQRSYDDAVAAADAARTQTLTALSRAQATFDRLSTTPGSDPDELEAAQQDLDAAHLAVSDAERSGVSSIASAADSVTLANASLLDLKRSPDVVAQAAAVTQAVEARDRAQKALTTLEATTGAIVPQGEIVFVPTLPARVQQAVTVLGPVGTGSGPLGVDGSQATETTALVTLAGGDLVVSMNARLDERPLMQTGMAAQLLDERTNTTYQATISQIAETSSTSSDGQIGFAVVITTDRALPPELAGANLRVTITAASTEAASLVVPLAAVSSSADGSTHISILPAETPTDADPVEVAVKAGLTADGFVAVEPVISGSLNEGDRVVVGR